MPGDVGSDGLPVVRGEGGHGGGLTEQVLLESDALVTGCEQVIAFLDDVPDQVPVPQGFPGQVLGGLDVVSQEEVSKWLWYAVVEKY